MYVHFSHLSLNCSDKSSGKVYYFRKDIWKEIQQIHLQSILSSHANKNKESALFQELKKEVKESAKERFSPKSTPFVMIWFFRN